MAAPATSLPTLSSLPIRSRRLSLLNPPQYSLSYPLKSPYLPLSLPSTPTKLSPLLCTPSDDLNIQLYGSDLFEYGVTYDPPEAPEGVAEVPGVDDGPLEDEDDITLAYEQIYGPAYSGVSVLGNDGYMMDDKAREEMNWEAEEVEEKIKDAFAEEVVQVRRVTKVVKGGKQFNFRVVVVVGDKLGNVGVGVGKAKEVAEAIRKSATNARRNVVRIPLTKYMTFPHRSDGKFGAAKVMLRPACPGSGVLAGGSVRTVLEMSGVQNALGKQLGSDNPLNNARATIVAMQKMKHLSEVAAERGIPMEELWK